MFCGILKEAVNHTVTYFSSGQNKQTFCWWVDCMYAMYTCTAGKKKNTAERPGKEKIMEIINVDMLPETEVGTEVAPLWDYCGVCHCNGYFPLCSGLGMCPWYGRINDPTR